ncbi:hypothetical protein HPB50_000804 [Hyalomma asiaticum]|uniref:Uncharacterized protein n=1 Tax=Hyalomma asiaticum TaxID=266040 RepID=A0ACB7TCT8_HYAAI|nr:hypothetical protein HPB50_000804 [Hyalomma asiaticum]
MSFWGKPHVHSLGIERRGCLVNAAGLPLRLSRPSQARAAEGPGVTRRESATPVRMPTGSCSTVARFYRLGQSTTEDCTSCGEPGTFEYDLLFCPSNTSSQEATCNRPTTPWAFRPEEPRVTGPPL